MLKSLKKKESIRALKGQEGQTSLAEYTVTVLLVVGAVTLMATFTQRTLQARMRDARHYMINQVRGACINSTDSSSNCIAAVGGSLGDQYEPYYVAVNAELSTNTLKQKGLYSTSSSKDIAIFQSNADTQMNSVSYQAPPEASGLGVDR